MSRRASRTAMLPLVVVALTLPTCSTAPSLEAGAGLTIVRDIPASGAIEAADFYSTQPVEATYTVVAGESRGSTREYRRRAADKYGAAVREELSGVRVEFLRMDRAGSIVMPAVIDHANEALTLFDPPMTVLPARLVRGETYEARSAMRVVDAGNPAKEKERGSAVRTVTYMGDRLLDTPIGEIPCHQLKVAFTADLRLADADTHMTLYIAREYGVVAEQWSEVVKVFGALSSEKGEVMVLASEPK